EEQRTVRTTAIPFATKALNRGVPPGVVLRKVEAGTVPADAGGAAFGHHHYRLWLPQELAPRRPGGAKRPLVNLVTQAALAKCFRHVFGRNVVLDQEDQHLSRVLRQPLPDLP